MNEIIHDGDQGCIEIKFSHVQLYVDHVCPVDEYKKLEAEINKKFSESESSVLNDDSGDVPSGGDILLPQNQCSSNEFETAFPSHGRDVVKVRQTKNLFLEKYCYISFINPIDENNIATDCRIRILRHGVLSEHPCLLSYHHKDSTGDEQ